jgi:LPXTG-motif cell wall-anchored protein
MLKKVTHIFIILLILTITANSVFADGQPPPTSNKNGNFSKKTFSKDNSWSREGKALSPPNPNTGGTGNRIPISGGLAILLIGSATYLLKRVRDEKQ